MDERVEDAEIVDAASLIAIAGPKQHYFDRKRCADCASTSPPWTVGKRAPVARPQVLKGFRARKCFDRRSENSRRGVGHHSVERFVEIGFVPVVSAHPIERARLQRHQVFLTQRAPLGKAHKFEIFEGLRDTDRRVVH